MINKLLEIIIVGIELDSRMLTVVPRRHTNSPIVIVDMNSRSSSDKLSSPASSIPISFLNRFILLMLYRFFSQENPTMYSKKVKLPFF
jgi:hypothetical protein